MLVCEELVRTRHFHNRGDPSRYHMLHPEGRRLISSWLERAWEQRDGDEEDCFEPFIFSWIALNGWAACITKLDRDRDWLDAITLNNNIAARFSSMLHDNTEHLLTKAQSFSVCWPIFKAQAIRSSGRVRRQEQGNRDQIVQYYLAGGIRQYEPQCWERHQQDPAGPPLDWPHIVAALYRVRCNLFHGEKAAHSEMDRLIVSRAFRVLVTFMQSSGYFC
jgi:hypothetical protein